jgi:hypothetical protein
VPFFFKQWGEYVPLMFDHGHWFRNPNHPRANEYGEVVYRGEARCIDGAYVGKVGKKLAGRLLDGVEHNGMPQSKELTSQ